MTQVEDVIGWTGLFLFILGEVSATCLLAIAGFSGGTLA